MFVVARWAERHLNVDGPPQKTHPIAPHLSPSVSPITQPQDVTPVRLDRYGNFKRPEGAPILKGSPPSGVPPRVRPPHPDQPWSKDAAREKIREERRRVAEAKAEQERIARAVEAAAKREASRTKRRRGGKKERHAHFVDGDENAIVGDENHLERPGTPPLLEPPVPSPRKTPTRKAHVPVYSVAGRKVSLFDLLREKILASGEGDARAAARAFKLAADKSGKIDSVAIAAVMRRFNVSATDDAVAAVMTRLDPGGRGLVDYRTFLDAVMEESSSTHRGDDDEGDVRSRSIPGSLHGKPKPARDVATYDGDVAAMRELIVDKIAQKFEGGSAALRRAFNSFDADGDGAVNESEFRAVLANFLIVPPADVLSALFAANADPATGRMTFAGFVHGFVPEDIRVGIDPDTEAKIRDGFSAKFSGPGEALAAAAASKGGTLLFADARDVLGPDADPELVRRIRELSDECREGLIPAESLRDAVIEHQKYLSDAAVQKAKRDFIDGFGRELKERYTKGKAPPVAAPKTVSADDAEEILREKLAAKSAGGAKEQRKAFQIFDKQNKGFIDRDAMVEALHHFHLVLRPEDVDSLMAKYDSSGGGKISFQDFIAKVLPADYPTASAKKARVVDAKIAGFTMELTGLLNEVEEMGGTPGSVARSEATRAAEQAAKEARVRLPPSAAHHAADAASIGDHLSEHPRVEPTKYIQSIVSIVRAAEEGAIEAAAEKEGVSEKFGDNSYVAPAELASAGFARRMSTNELLAVVHEKFSAKVPHGKSATWYYSRLLDAGKDGLVGLDGFQNALKSVGLGAVDPADAEELFAEMAEGAETVTVAQFTRKLTPGPAKRPDADALRRSFESLDASQVGALSEEDIRGVLTACDVEVDQAAISRALGLCVADPDLRGPDAKGKIDYERFARAIGEADLGGVNKTVAPTLESFGKEEVDVNVEEDGDGVKVSVRVKTVMSYSPDTLKAMNVGCDSPPRSVELGSDIEEPEEPRSPDSLPEPSPGHIEVKQWDGPVVKRINQL